MKDVEIYLLGDFRIIVNGEDIIPQFGGSKKKLSLLSYLIVNRNKALSITELFEQLWPGDDNANPESALKTLVSRLRKTLLDYGLQNAIVTRNGAYMWNAEMPCNVDLFEFEELCEVISKQSKCDLSTKRMVDKVQQLYTGNLLATMSSESWAMAKSMFYHNLYVSTIYAHAQLLAQNEEYDEIVKVCRKALDIDPLDSKLNLELMTALMKLGKNKEAMDQYELTTDMHYTYLGLRPSEEILSFYKTLIRTERTSEADIREICNDLLEGDDAKGAFVCEYAIFKDIYRLQMRNLKRLGNSMLLVLVTVSPVNGQKYDNLMLDKLMRQLLSTLLQALRKGDTISRYSPTQFAILLSSVNFDTGRKVMERVKSTFYSLCPTSRFVLSYRLAPLDAD